jgi:hypothetical protein
MKICITHKQEPRGVFLDDVLLGAQCWKAKEIHVYGLHGMNKKKESLDDQEGMKQTLTTTKRGSTTSCKIAKVCC